MTKLEELSKRLSEKYWSEFIIKQIEPVMGIREFLNGEPVNFDNYIIGETRPLEKHEISEWLAEDELKIKLLIEINSELKRQKQELIDYLKEKIEKLHNDTSGLYSSVVYGKIETYKEILMILEKRDK